MAGGEQVPSKALDAQKKASGLIASEKAADLYRPIVFGSHQWKFKAFTALVTAGAPPLAAVRVFTSYPAVYCDMFCSPAQG